MPASGNIELGIRPEFVDVAPPAARAADGQRRTVDDLGRCQVRARASSAAAKSRASRRRGRGGPGERRRLVFDPARVHVYADSWLVEGVA